MKYSTKVSDAVHILAFIVLNPRGSLSSDSIAESLHTNPGCVRQLMSALRRAGLLLSVKGHPKPSLSKVPSAITLLDLSLIHIYEPGSSLLLAVPYPDPHGSESPGHPLS